MNSDNNIEAVDINSEMDNIFLKEIDDLGELAEVEPLMNKIEVENELPEISDTLYQVTFGDDENEYYTWYTPKIENNLIYVTKLIQKGVIQEEVFDKYVEVNFRVDLPDNGNEKIIKVLSTGVLIRSVESNQLEWLNKDYKVAKEELKEESLNAYKQLAPQLVQRIKTLESTKKKNNSLNSLDINFD